MPPDILLQVLHSLVRQKTRSKSIRLSFFIAQSNPYSVSSLLLPGTQQDPTFSGKHGSAAASGTNPVKGGNGKVFFIILTFKNCKKNTPLLKTVVFSGRKRSFSFRWNREKLILLPANATVFRRFFFVKPSFSTGHLKAKVDLTLGELN